MGVPVESEIEIPSDGVVSGDKVGTMVGVGISVLLILRVACHAPRMATTIINNNDPPTSTTFWVDQRLTIIANALDLRVLVFLGLRDIDYMSLPRLASDLQAGRSQNGGFSTLTFFPTPQVNLLQASFHQVLALPRRRHSPFLGLFATERAFEGLGPAQDCQSSENFCAFALTAAKKGCNFCCFHRLKVSN